MQKIKKILEARQLVIYFGLIVVAITVAMLFPSTVALERFVNPALAIMLFVTFLQVPIADLMKAFVQFRFLAGLLAANFLVVPLLVTVLMKLLPSDSMVQLGVLLVLLTPCIDYVVTFSHLGKADARLLPSIKLFEEGLASCLQMLSFSKHMVEFNA